MSSERPDKPRPHHYTFAHRILPTLFFRNPQQLCEYLTPSFGVDYLKLHWDSISRRIGSETPPSTGLACEAHRLEDGTTIIVVTMPSPVAVTEAYYIALVYRTEPALTRYFTLEFGISFNPSITNPRVLCEWTGETHNNYGSQNAPDQAAFLKLVIEKLSI